MSAGERGKRRCPREALAWAAAGPLFVASSLPALADCSPTSPLPLANLTVTCTAAGGAQTSPVGSGRNNDNVTVNVQNGATISASTAITNPANAISLGNNATVTVGAPGGGATATVTTFSTGGSGYYGTGNNTVEFNANSTVTIWQNGVVSATGTQNNSEAINPYGPGNTITNYGLIKAGASSAIFFENVNTTGSSPRNAVFNYGTIDARGGTNPVTGGQAIGSFNNVGIDITNETGAFIYGNLDLQGGNDNVTLKTGSTITGSLNGGGGTNALILDAATGASDALPGVVQNFQSLTKTGPGIWTLTGSVGQSSGAPLAVTVEGGTLVLTGNNASFNGNVTINSGATLEARAQSLPPLIDDLHGDLLINQVSPDGVQPDDGTYAGTIEGSGVVTKIGVGTVTLTGANTYSGGTFLDEGAIAIAADTGLGASTGPLTFDGGALQFLASFNLSPSRAITLQSGGGTLDANGFATTVSQAISGPGALTIASTAPGGVVTLTGTNTYAGGTTISGGTLQLGNGGASGSIVGNVVDNGALAFDRSDVTTFAGVVSGSGSVSQIGSGTTILTATNTYAGPTNVLAGALAIGDPTHASAALAGGGPVTVASGATLGGYGAVAGDVTSAGTVAVANALNAFGGGPTGTFTIGGSLHNNGTALIEGPGVGNVLAVSQNYAAGPGATAGMATLLNAGGPLSNQVTDRLLVSGNVSGNTSVVVRAFGQGALTTPDFPSATHGISLIQVAGNSSTGAFALPGGYVDGGTPYRYQLYAFGPGSPNGAASASQSVVAGGVNWDYRLENVYVSPIGPEPPEPPGPPAPPPPDSRPELAPQIPSYLSLPTALFDAGLQDLDSLHRRLGEIRDEATRGSPEDGEVFIRSYGNAFRYDSNRSFAGYGFNSTQDYGAVQFGANAIVRHGLDGTLRAGLFGAVGELWLEPSAADGASSGRFNTYTVAGALTWQSAQGWYVDGIVAGGAFYGNVNAAVRGRAANSAGNTISASIETGYPVALGWQGLALEPQLQLIGERLDFAPFIDSDGIAAHIGSQSQGVFRAGVRLLKPFATADNGLFTPFLKANLLQGIGGGGTVNIAGDPFSTGTYGTAVQVGGGVNGNLSRNLSAYGDVAWQNAVSTGGFRGWTFNAGVRYTF